jgi:membrane protease YdiL (CAAX protease family)
MIVFAIMAVGAAGVVVVWRLVAVGRLTIWTGQVAWFGAAGLAAVATGRVDLSPRVAWGWAVAGGVGAGAALYAATIAFVTVARRWPAFERHVDQIYDQRRGLSGAAAIVLAAAVVAPGEELFWRGLFQGRLALAVGWLSAAVLTWVAYVGANAASVSLPIVAAAIVSGAVWGGLALWTHGVLASVCCHALWTALMVAAPPSGPTDRSMSRRTRSAEGLGP